jgi:hypothetical protein
MFFITSCGIIIFTRMINYSVFVNILYNIFYRRSPPPPQRPADCTVLPRWPASTHRGLGSVLDPNPELLDCNLHTPPSNHYISKFSYYSCKLSYDLQYFIRQEAQLHEAYFSAFKRLF